MRATGSGMKSSSPSPAASAWALNSGPPAMTPGEAPIVLIESMRSSETDDGGLLEVDSAAPMPAGQYAIRVTARTPRTVISSIEVGLVT